MEVEASCSGTHSEIELSEKRVEIINKSQNSRFTHINPDRHDDCLSSVKYYMDVAWVEFVSTSNLMFPFTKANIEGMGDNYARHNWELKGLARHELCLLASKC